MRITCEVVLKQFSFLSFAVLSVISGVAIGQTSNAALDGTKNLSLAQKAHWGLGIGTVLSPSIYAGEDLRVLPLPLVTYEGERFFLRGISGGVHLVKRDRFTVDGILSYRTDGIDREDFGVSELAERGINRALLSDRDNGIDLGLSANWRSEMGRVELGIKTDVSGASKGYEALLKYGYPLQWGRTSLVPNVGVSFMSKKLANYYYGTLPEEVTRGVVNYKPGSTTVPSLGINAIRQLDTNWVIIGNATYKFLPNKITNSPLVEDDTNGSLSVFLGVSRRF